MGLAKVMSGAVIYPNCKLGEDVFIGHNTILRDGTVVGAGSYIGSLVMCEGRTTIGERCGINAQCHLTRGMTIGDEVFLGPGVITSNDKRMLFRRKGHGQNLMGPTVQRGARIGAGAMLMPGVVVGENAVVGAYSVVTKDVVARTVVMGNPARLAKHDTVPEEECL